MCNSPIRICRKRFNGSADGDIASVELPTRRRLDCGTAKVLGGEDAAWLARKDVPMDYGLPSISVSHYIRESCNTSIQ